MGGMPPQSDLQARLDALGAGHDVVVRAVELVLDDAVRRSASDVHFEPTPAALEVRVRADGVLHRVATIDRKLAPNVVARLKVMADLLTYRVDVPQEGGVRPALVPRAADMRVSTFPTVHGEKAVVRVFAGESGLLDLEELGLSADTLGRLTGLLHERSGAVFLTGPSGSGKTTTIYGCLRRLVRNGGGRHVVTIEDPVERWVEGVSQSQARPGTEFDF